MRIKKKIFILGVFFSALSFSMISFSESFNLGGDLNSNIDVQGIVINLGAVLGQASAIETEVSIGSAHNDLKINGNYTTDISVNGIKTGVSVLNTALSEGGNEGICAKVSIGSIGPGTCKSYIDNR